jgi:hypothetical protein
LIHYVVEQEVANYGIIMSKGVESILVTRQETVVLQGAEPIVAKHVHVAIRMEYNEPKFNQQNGSIIRGVPRDWSRRIIV